MHLTIIRKNMGLLFENRAAFYFCNYKENKKNNTRMLDTLFIEDFIDSSYGGIFSFLES